MQVVDSSAAEAMTMLLSQAAVIGETEPDWLKIVQWAIFVYSLTLRNPEAREADKRGRHIAGHKIRLWGGRQPASVCLKSVRQKKSDATLVSV
jgi:hypothetical protein